MDKQKVNDEVVEFEQKAIAPLNAVTCCPEVCPIALKCPIGPMPNLNCAIKDKYTKEVNSSINNMFPMLSTQPVVMMKVNFMLVPLFEQLLKLKMAEYAHFNVMSGGKVNPILKETRSTIAAIQKIVDSVLENQNKAIDDLDDVNTKDSYYDMLFTTGQAAVDERQGFDRGFDEGKV